MPRRAQRGLVAQTLGGGSPARESWACSDNWQLLEVVRPLAVARREVLDSVHFKPHGWEKPKKATEIFGIFILIMLERS